MPVGLAEIQEEDKAQADDEEVALPVSELQETDEQKIIEQEPSPVVDEELGEDVTEEDAEVAEPTDEELEAVELPLEDTPLVEEEREEDEVAVQSSINDEPVVDDENSAAEDAETPEPESEEKEEQIVAASLPEEEFVARCIANDEAAKAYWIVRSCHMDLSADLIGAYALGSKIGVGSAIPGELQGFYGKLVTEDFGPLHSKLFLLGAVAGVALFAEPPSGEVSTLISFVDTGIKHLDNLVNLIKSDFLFQGAVRVEDLSMVLSEEDKDLEVNRLRDMSIELLNRIRSSSLSYEPANILLRHLYQEGAELTDLHRAVEKNDESKMSFVRQIIKNTTGESIVSEAHKRGIKNIAKPIDGNARNQVIRRLNETLSLGREWLNLSSSQSVERDQSLQEKKLIQLKGALEIAVANLGGVGQVGLEKIAAMALRNCFVKLLRNLNGEPCQRIKPLSAEIIADLQVELDDDFEIAEGSKSCLLQNFSTEKTVELSEENIKILFDRNEFIRAKVLIDRHEELAGASDHLYDQVERLKAKISTEIKTLNDMVEDAYLLGQLAVLGEQDAEDRSAESLRSELPPGLIK
jgi:hypothetical protein